MNSNRDTTTVACSLELHEGARRRADWQALAARAAVETTLTGPGLILSFRADPGVEAELDRLVALERGCCAWADWSVRSEGARLELHVSGESDEATTAIRGMVGDLAASSSAPTVPAQPAAKSTRSRTVALAGALGLACLACVVPLLLAIGAGGSLAEALGGIEGVFIGSLLSLGVFAAATHLIRRRKEATGRPAESGCGC